jgi:hypothetical protein
MSMHCFPEQVGSVSGKKQFCKTLVLSFWIKGKEKTSLT